MNRPECPRCGLAVAGKPHETAEDCVAQLAPRYQLAQQSITRYSARCRALEERLERMQIKLRVATRTTTREAKLARRVEAIERKLGVDVKDRVAHLEHLVNEGAKIRAIA